MAEFPLPSRRCGSDQAPSDCHRSQLAYGSDVSLLSCAACLLAARDLGWVAIHTAWTRQQQNSQRYPPGPGTTLKPNSDQRTPCGIRQHACKAQDAMRRPGALPVMTYRLLSTIYRGGRDVARQHCFNARCRDGGLTSLRAHTEKRCSGGKDTQPMSGCKHPHASFNQPQSSETTRWLHDYLSASSMTQ